MSSFDPKIWKDKARQRYEKSISRCKRGSIASSAEFRMKRDFAYIDKIKHVVEWCEERSIDVQFCHNGGSMYETTGEIKINSRHVPEKQLYLLLHECGHHLIGDKEKHERYGMGYSTDDPATKRSLLHRIDVLDEELEAWYRGKKLANRLGISIDSKHFDKFRASCIRTYVKWTLKNGQTDFTSWDADY